MYLLKTDDKRKKAAQKQEAELHCPLNFEPIDHALQTIR